MLGRVHLEELGNVEEHGRFLEVGEVLTLVQEKDDFVEQVLAFAVFQFLVVEDL